MRDGVMKAAIAAAAAAQLSVGQALTLGNIKGIMPQRNREEDNAAREALERTESKQPLVQDRDITAPSTAGAVEGGPVKSTPDILNLDEPGKKIRSELGKLTDKVKGVSGPAVWGRNLQVEVKNVAPVVDQDRIAESSKKGDAGDVAAKFGPGQQSAAGVPGGDPSQSTETFDFRAGAADQSPEARFGAPTAAAKALSADTV